jgi:hypothetical protein
MPFFAIGEGLNVSHARETLRAITATRLFRSNAGARDALITPGGVQQELLDLPVGLRPVLSTRWQP